MGRHKEEERARARARLANLYFSAQSESFLASLIYLSGIATGSLLFANRKPTGAAAENALGKIM